MQGRALTLARRSPKPEHSWNKRIHMLIHIPKQSGSEC